ncbi:MAG TPA: Gfo/Idh/MocA family oxidoreductase [Verrucomicrobiae bacterium]|nr:Gfo/Idh/MocA family oxidoreductase [Verrucomicrobiae bacterium]
MTSGSNSNGINRRQFIATTSIAGGGVLLGASALAQSNPTITSSPRRKRYALVGVGGRSGMYRDAVLRTYAEHCEMVGYCDVNLGRLQLAQARSRAAANVEVPIFEAKDFDRMIRETKPDVVIVTTKDSAHDEYVIRAMELGCDAMTEKPMTTDESKCRAILKAQRKTGRKCTVTFNYRYSPHRTQVKDLLMSGIIGDILSVDFHWLLDTVHGADYFRRWHSRKENSGGLMVHKATHHFDLVNWWLSAVPTTVFANGKRDFYTPQMAKRMGLQSHHERCLTCPEKDKCTFYLDLRANRNFRELYLENEKYDGYHRDQCVWRPDIDIEDTMNVVVRYNTGATLSYSLNAFNGWEGYRIAFNGTKGRLEHGIQEKVYVFGDGSTPGAVAKEGTYIRLFPLRAPAREVELWPSGEGGHGGGDRVMLDDLFLPQKPADKYLRAADHRAGAYSILTGVAANRSIRSGKPVEISGLAGDIALPDYAPMPSHRQPLPMPPRS